MLNSFDIGLEFRDYGCYASFTVTNIDKKCCYKNEVLSCTYLTCRPTDERMSTVLLDVARKLKLAFVTADATKNTLNKFEISALKLWLVIDISSDKS